LTGVVVAHATTIQKTTAVLREAGRTEVAKENEEESQKAEEENR
jgi:hypothetical protein